MQKELKKNNKNDKFIDQQSLADIEKISQINDKVLKKLDDYHKIKEPFIIGKESLYKKLYAKYSEEKANKANPGLRYFIAAILFILGVIFFLFRFFRKGKNNIFSSFQGQFTPGGFGGEPVKMSLFKALRNLDQTHDKIDLFRSIYTNLEKPVYQKILNLSESKIDSFDYKKQFEARLIKIQRNYRIIIDDIFNFLKKYQTVLTNEDKQYLRIYSSIYETRIRK